MQAGLLIVCIIAAGAEAVQRGRGRGMTAALCVVDQYGRHG
jgi:hypothetical protein